MDTYNSQNIPKLYQITGMATLVFTVILIAYAIYNQFFYVDGTWLHGFTANGFAVFSMFIKIGILVVFKRFLNRILNYKKANVLINAYLIFSAIAMLTLGNIFYKSIELYISMENSADLSALSAFSSSSISGVIFLVISSYAMILISILLGYRLSRIRVLDKKLFQILGYSFIAYGIISFLTSITLIENSTFQVLVNAVAYFVVGLILNKASGLNRQEIYNLTGFEIEKAKEGPKPKTSPTPKIKEPKESKPRKKRFTKAKTSETDVEQEELPSLNLDALDDKELVISYYKDLPVAELKRLENIVERKYNRILDEAQKENLVLHYIIEKRMYDHQRFLPK